MNPPGASGLEGLRDIQDIASVPWWPLAAGWWLLLAGLPLLGFALWRWRWLLAVGAGWRPDARRALRQLRRRAPGLPSKQVAAELSRLLRRIAMARLGRAACAGLHGDDWLRWLTEQDPRGFDWRSRARILARLPYAPGTDGGEAFDWRPLIAAAEAWTAAPRRRWPRLPGRREDRA